MRLVKRKVSPSTFSPPYQRHEPEKTLLYQTVHKHFSAFLAQCESVEKKLPGFVKKELEAFLKCGILAHGFARVYCPNCRFERLVAFSCKRRGFCPSCLSRRMAQTAAHLVDAVIPFVPTRQWVLSVPAPLRYWMAYDSEACNYVLSVFIRSVASFLRLKAKKELGLSCVKMARVGAITFVQRFGSALNLNVHFHTLFADGVFVGNAFRSLKPPTQKEIRTLTLRIAKQVQAWLSKKMDGLSPNSIEEEEPLLAACWSASIKNSTALGERAGLPVLRIVSGEELGQQDDRALNTIPSQKSNPLPWCVCSPCKRKKRTHSAGKKTES